MQSFLKKARQSQFYGVALLILVTLIIWIIFWLLTNVINPGSFGQPDKMLTYLQRGLIYSVGACGFYFVVVQGLFDFSIGSMIILSELMSIAFIPQAGWFSVIVIPVLTGFVLGLVNGLVFKMLRIPSMIVTVGMSLIYEALSVWASGINGTTLQSEFSIFGSYPWNLVFALACFFVTGFIIKYTKIGTYSNAIGSNELTAKNMGVNVDKYKVIALTLTGTFCGAMAVLYLGYGTAQTPQTGMLSQSLNFLPLMGVFFGIAFKRYGHPIVAIVIGEFMVSMMLAGFIAIGVSTTVNQIVTGITVLLILALTTKRRNGAVVK
ncbi:MAG: ABC transporter permease [Atopobiaceae bacterium]|jgi:ribose transport system permease protein|nr:ABC transporter permease [Olegusella sp.]MCI1933907.1 ABC transporter permease [Atopobiaceae bacterium]NLH92171.1 ABC transporter permease [Atopobium sp.]